MFALKRVLMAAAVGVTALGATAATTPASAHEWVSASIGVYAPAPVYAPYAYPVPAYGYGFEYWRHRREWLEHEQWRRFHDWRGYGRYGR